MTSSKPHATGRGQILSDGCFTSCGTGITVLIAVVALIGTLFGWLLRGSETVLACTVGAAAT